MSRSRRRKHAFCGVASVSGRVVPCNWARRAGKVLVAFVAAFACLFSMVAASGTAQANDSSSTAISLGDEITGYKMEYRTITGYSNGQPVYGPWTTMEPNSDGSYDFDADKNPNWQYRIRAEYSLKPYYLKDKNTDSVTYKVPDSLKVLSGSSGDVLGTDGYTKYGTYTLDKNGQFTIVFNKTAMDENGEGGVINGWLTFEAQVSRKGEHEGGEIDLPGNGGLINVGKKYDLNVQKTKGTLDNASQTLPFTITVSSPEYGTPGKVKLSDVMENGSIKAPVTVTGTHADGSSFTVVLQDADGKNIDANALDGKNSFEAYLPQLAAGDTIVISYDGVGNVALGGNGDIKNTAHVESKDDNGHEVKSEASADWWFENKPDLSKTASGVDANGAIKWTVVVNKDHRNLKGWTLNDLPGAGLQNSLQDVQVYEEGHPEQATKVSFPVTFSKDNTKTYVFTYSTAIDGKSSQANQKDFSNTVSICPTDSQDGNLCASKSGTYSMSNPFAKSSIGNVNVFEDQNTKERSANLSWQLNIGSSDRDLKGPWTYTDTLQSVTQDNHSYPHYFTDAQQTAIEKSIKDAISDAYRGTGVTPEYTIAFGSSNGSQQKNQFTITMQTDLPKETKISFKYSSTVALGTEYNGLRFTNCANIGNFWDCPSADIQEYHKPTDPQEPDYPKFNMVKHDSAETNGPYSDFTNHDYTSLNTTKTATSTDKAGTPYMSWTIDFNPSWDMVGKSKGDLVLTEKLPKGTHLLTGISANDGEAGLQLEGRQYDDKGASKVFTFNGNHGQATYVTSWWPREETAYATADLQDDGTVRITIPQATLQNWADKVGMTNYDGWKYQQMRLIVRVAFDDGQFDDYEVSHAYENTVVASFPGSKDVESSQEQTIRRDAWKNLVDKQNMNKIHLYDQSNPEQVDNEARYQLNINPDSLCVGQKSDNQSRGACSPSAYTFKDVAKYQHIAGYNDAQLVLDPDSVHIYVPDKNGSQIIERVKFDERGNVITTNHGTVVDGGDVVPEVEKIKVRELDSSQYSYVVDSEQTDTYNGWWTSTLTFTVPNKTALIVDYTYKVIGAKDSYVAISNVAEVNGKKAWPADRTFAAHITQAAAGADVAEMPINVFKVNADNNAERLPGAEFELYGWEGKNSEHPYTWKKLETKSPLRTNEKGQLSLHKSIFKNPDEFTYNRAYKLVEVEAPSGYVCEQEPKYFVIDNADTDKYPVQWPWEFGKDGYEYANGTHVVVGTFMYFKDAPVILPLTGMLGGARWIVLGGAVLAVIAGAFAMDSQRAARRRLCSTLSTKPTMRRR